MERLIGGSVLAQTELPRMNVRLPRTLSKAAVAAWERDESERVDLETSEEQVRRHRTATLGLAGLSIVNAGRWEGEEVVVPLSPDLIGVAADAADDLPSRFRHRANDRFR